MAQVNVSPMDGQVEQVCPSTGSLWPVGQLLEKQVTNVLSVAFKHITQSWSQSVPSPSNSSSLASEGESPCSDEPSVQPLPEYTLSQVAEHISPSDCWIVIYDKVYDVSTFLSQHLGGEFIILEWAGRDATIPFRSTRHGEDSYKLLDKYLIGILVEKERMYKNRHTPERQG